MDAPGLMSIASSLNMVAAVAPGSTDVVATPVSLTDGTFLARSTDPKARALVAVVAVSNARSMVTCSGSIQSVRAHNYSKRGTT